VLPEENFRPPEESVKGHGGGTLLHELEDLIKGQFLLEHLGPAHGEQRQGKVEVKVLAEVAGPAHLPEFWDGRKGELALEED